MNGVTLYKEDAGFFTRLAAFQLMPQYIQKCTFEPLQIFREIWQESCKDLHPYWQLPGIAYRGRWGVSCHVC